MGQPYGFQAPVPVLSAPRAKLRGIWVYLAILATVRGRVARAGHCRLRGDAEQRPEDRAAADRRERQSLQSAGIPGRHDLRRRRRQRRQLPALAGLAVLSFSAEQLGLFAGGPLGTARPSAARGYGILTCAP